MGSVVFSVDAELGWGFSDQRDPPASRMAAGRTGWRSLLDVFATHDVAATWAIVGHLFLDERDQGQADHPAVQARVDADRPGWRAGPDLRFGSDLVASVAESPVGHELACHTFSHVLFGETTRDVAWTELTAAVQAAADADVELDSFVFPRNDVGHRDLLATFGFRCYRGVGSAPNGRLGRTVGKLLATAGLRSVDLVTPVVDEHGLVDIPPSLYLFGFEGWPRRAVTALWDDPIVLLAKRGIDRASREDGIFHMWLHPNNLRTERDVERVERIVAYTAARRAETELRIETMGDVAARVQGRAAPTMPPERVR